MEKRGSSGATVLEDPAPGLRSSSRNSVVTGLSEWLKAIEVKIPKISVSSFNLMVNGGQCDAIGVGDLYQRSSIAGQP